jgi:carbon-monoxide dehydrogenase small subunit
MRLTVNGRSHEVEVEPRVLLADLLRDQLRLTGTNLGCEHGVCGSCTVLLDGRPVRSCLVLAVQCDGSAVTTVEGLADVGHDGAATLQVLQQAFSEEHALQCGFCTPGFLVLLAHQLATDPQLLDDAAELDRLLASSLCRCTGYAGIRRAARRAREVTSGGGAAQHRGGVEHGEAPASPSAAG